MIHHTVSINIIAVIFNLFFYFVEVIEIAEARPIHDEIPGFLSGNYEIRKSKKIKIKLSDDTLLPEIRMKRLPTAQEVSENQGIRESNPEPSLNKFNKGNSVKESKESVQVQGQSQGSLEVAEPSLKEQVSSVFVGEESHKLNSYLEQIHPDDSRNNQMEFDLRAGFVNQNSNSNFSYRNYRSQFSIFDIGTNLWLAPGFGVFGKLMYSIGAYIENNDPVLAHTPTKFENMILGIKVRQFFGLHRKSSSVESRVFLTEDQVIVPADDTQRLKLKTNGIGVGLRAYTPQSSNWTYFLGAIFAPRLFHSESLTGVSVKSGSAADTTRFGLDLGFESKFDRQNQFLFEMNIMNEKNLFSGEAGGVDPLSGVRPTNVAVSNTIFSILVGYRWGK